jgi:hypothetical protein
MSIYSVVDFWRGVQTNPALASKVTALVQQANDDACGVGATIAREAGFDATPEELRDVGEVVAFWNRVERDETLCRKLEPARECETADLAMREITKVASEAGFKFSLEALQHVTAALVNAGRATAAPGANGELSEAELEGVAGGVSSMAAPLDVARRRLWQEIESLGPGVVGAKP